MASLDILSLFYDNNAGGAGYAVQLIDGGRMSLITPENCSIAAVINSATTACSATTVSIMSAN